MKMSCVQKIQSHFMANKNVEKKTNVSLLPLSTPRLFDVPSLKWL